MPYLEGNILKVLQATGGANGGMTAQELATVVFAPVGRVQMMLRRMLDRGTVQITSGIGKDARYLLTGMRPNPTEPPPRSTPEDFGFGAGGSGFAGNTSGERSASDAASSASREENRRLWEDNQRLQREVESLRRENSDLRRALARPPPAPPPRSDAVFRARIDELLTLCHPDRHGNSDRANEVTRWLIGLRKGK